MTPQQVFARNLRRQRHDAKLSQERLAFASGLHRTEVSLLERGVRDPRLSTVARLARALGIQAQVLVEDVEKARPSLGGDGSGLGVDRRGERKTLRSSALRGVSPRRLARRCGHKPNRRSRMAFPLYERRRTGRRASPSDRARATGVRRAEAVRERA